MITALANQGAAHEDAGLAAFLRSYESLLAEERALRGLAEERTRAYAQVMADVGRMLDPGEMDRQSRADPHFPGSLDPAGWRRLFAEIIAGRAQGAPGWAGVPSLPARPEGQASEPGEMDRLRAEVFRLSEALREARTPLGRKREPAQGAGADDKTGGQAAPPRPGPVVDLPPLPARAPGRFSDHFKGPDEWRRKGLALAILGVTGWSLRMAIADAIATHIPDTKGTSGSWKTAYTELESAELWLQRVIEPGGGLTAHIVAVSLTEQGRRLLRTIGIQPVPSEWEVLMADHGGEEQARHASLVVTFAYHARLRGYATTVCPKVASPAEPDVLLTKGDEKIFVEVEAGSGEPERLMRKWRNQAALQGSVALCSTTAEARKVLTEDARHAADRGMATDLATLIGSANAEDYALLWAETWP